VALLLSGVIAALGTVEVHASGPSSHAPGHATRYGAAAATKYVYLTFDDGPDAHYTPQVLEVLRRFGVRATFFELGSSVARRPDLTARVHLRGHSVQNHTWSHPDLTEVSWIRFRREVLATDRAIRAQIGYTPHCLRPPYGAVNDLVYERAARLGKKIRLWTVDPRDWSRPGVATIVHRVLSNVVSGSVVLFHDGGGDRSQTVAALPRILRTLKARGYRFARLWCG